MIYMKKRFKLFDCHLCYGNMNKLRTKLPLQLTAGKQNRTLGNESLFYSIKNLQWSNPFKKRMTVIFFHSGLL